MRQLKIDEFYAFNKLGTSKNSKLINKLEFLEPIQAHVVRGILSPEGDSQ